MNIDPWAAWQEDEDPFDFGGWRPPVPDRITLATGVHPDGLAAGERGWHEATIALDDLTPDGRQAATALWVNGVGAWPHRDMEAITIRAYHDEPGSGALVGHIRATDDAPTLEQADRLLTEMWGSYAEAWRSRRDRLVTDAIEVHRKWSDRWQAQDDLLARPAAEDELRVTRVLSPLEKFELNAVFMPHELYDRRDVYAETVAVQLGALSAPARDALAEWRETAAGRPEWARDDDGPLVIRHYEYSYEHDAWYSTPYQSPDVSPAAISQALVEMVGSYRDMVADKAHEAVLMEQYREEDELEALAWSEPTSKRGDESDVEGDLSPARARQRNSGAGY